MLIDSMSTPRTQAVADKILVQPSSLDSGDYLRPTVF